MFASDYIPTGAEYSLYTEAVTRDTVVDLTKWAQGNYDHVVVLWDGNLGGYSLWAWIMPEPQIITGHKQSLEQLLRILHK